MKCCQKEKKNEKNNFFNINTIYLYVTNIKGHESRVKNFNFNFLAPLSQNFKMLHFDANPITI